jgi:two-component system, OmpR family, response regulator RegX3
MKQAVILVIEKDRSLSAGIAGALHEAGYGVIETDDAADGLKKIYQMHPDLIIAGTDLQTVNGEDACLRLCQASYLPMIAISRRDEVVEMLEIGVDACIVSPPNGRELVARVRSLLKNHVKKNTMGEWDAEGLSPTESRLGSYLFFNKGRLLDYPQLITGVWGGKNINLDTLHFYMRSLSRKLSAFRISNVRGIGYTFIGWDDGEFRKRTGR